MYSLLSVRTIIPLFTIAVLAMTEGLGRLKPGISLAQARAEMETIMRNLMDQYPADNYKAGVNVLSYFEDISGAFTDGVPRGAEC
jgi:hypothetical protein